MKNQLALITKFIAYFKILNVCFVNELLDRHVLKLVDENNKRSLSNRAQRSNNRFKTTFTSRSHTLDSLDDDERTRSIPIILGEHFPGSTEIKKLSGGPSLPPLIKDDILDSNEEFASKPFLLKNAAENPDDGVFSKRENRSSSFRLNLMSVMAILMHLIMSYGNCQTYIINQKHGIDTVDRLNIVILPAILTFTDYTICENLPLLTNFLKNIVLLEVYANLSSFNFSIPLKFCVWLLFLVIYISTMKLNSFAKSALNNLESNINFKLFQISLDIKFVIFRLVLFTALLFYVPILTLFPMILILKVIISVAQVVNLRFKQQADPYHIFKICLTFMTWTCSLTVFGTPISSSSYLAKRGWFENKNNLLWMNVVFLIKRVCLVMACKYFALIVFDYKLTLVPLPKSSNEINLHNLTQPINLFKKLKKRNEKVIAKCNFIETMKVDHEYNY